MSKIKTTVFNDEQELLKSLIDIHLEKDRFDIDPMYFKGNFYKEIPEPKLKFDIEPQFKEVEQSDATDLPLKNQSKSSIILDPPFMFGIHGKTENYYSSKTHGIFKDFKELEETYRGIIKEAFRILETQGILVFKCQDYTDSKTTMTHCLVWKWAIEQGFYPKDLAILNIERGKVANGNLTQRHLRKTHSYFFVFQKKTKRFNINGFN